MTGYTRGLIVENLSVRDAAGESLVAPFSLSLPAGSLHVILGESGAGKTMSTRLIMRYFSEAIDEVTERNDSSGEFLF